MSPSPKQEFKLGDEQERVAQRLFDRSQRHLVYLAQVSSQRKGDAYGCPATQPDPIGQLKTPRQSNCAGVFGRRGSGKTTVLVEVLHRLAAQKTGWTVLARPLDLSYAPREFPHGLTVLHWLHEELRGLASAPRTQDAAKAFQQAARSYFRGADGFNKLVQDRAISAEHYAQAAASEIRMRLRLWADIRDWLDAQAWAMNTRGFVVAVDDLDLAPANAHHSMVWSLLDELHQDRLFFVLAGDLGRLERRLAEEDAGARRRGAGELDAQAASDLVYKVLPQVDRAELEPWPVLQRAAFPPNSVPDRSIGGRAARMGLSPVLRRHLNALLPEWPRGLENVLRELAQRARDELADSTSPRDLNLDLLSFLAEASFDFDLARSLRRRPLAEWAPVFAWRESGTTTLATWQILDRRLQGGDDLPELLPDPQTSELPLGLSSVRWAEVLVDLALHAGSLSPLRWLLRVPWAQARLGQCEVQLDRTEDSVDRAFDSEPLAMLATLYWLRWTASPGKQRSIGRFAIGFWPVLQWLVGDRRLWPGGMEEEVWSPNRLAARVVEADKGDGKALGAVLGDAQAAEIPALLPHEARRLLAQVDALARQPWAALNEVEAAAGPHDLARLAATLAYRAFRSRVIELQVSEDLATERLSTRLVTVVQEGRALGPADITDAFTKVRIQAEADVQELGERQDDPSAALRAFLQAPWFRGLAPD